jgi:hypothetical protein
MDGGEVVTSIPRKMRNEKARLAMEGESRLVHSCGTRPAKAVRGIGVDAGFVCCGCESWEAGEPRAQMAGWR